MRKFCFHLQSSQVRKFNFHANSHLEGMCEHRLIEPFLEACRRGNLDKVEAFLESGVDVNSVTEEGGEDFALMYAVQQNNLDLLDLLLANEDIDVDMPGPDNITPLMKACHDDRPEIVRKMIAKSQICLDLQDCCGNTAAMVAVLAESVDCLQLLSEKELDWNLGDDDQDDSAAILAVRVENLQVIEILSKIGSVDWNRRNEKDESAFSIALKKKDKEVIKLILSNVSHHDIDIEHLKRQNVHEAAVKACQQYITEKVADINNGNSSRIFALREGISKLLNANIEEGSSPKKRFRLLYEDSSQCPVCFSAFSKEVKVFHCSEGHFTCGMCRPRLNKCPECRAKFIGRAIGFERTLC